LVTQDVAALLDLDPDLWRGLDEARRERARRELRVTVGMAPGGAWESPDRARVGLLLVDGVVAREVVMGRDVCIELLGAGDLVRPWEGAEPDAFIAAAVRWNVLSPLRFAVLDTEFAARAVAYPGVGLALLGRVELRAHRLATLRAIGQLVGVEDRLLAVLWLMSERWGRVRPDGVALPLCLPHRTLGELIGARRPSVSTATAALMRAGRLSRRRDGSWLLHGEPPGTGAAPEQAAERRPLVVAPDVAASAPARIDDLARLLLADDAASGF
jgi:CRP/FNR family transcriptional regulator, cyclic AMP receptor protein